jgi:Holliday junction resolvase
MKEQLEAFVILSQSTKYYQWLKNHPEKVDFYRQGRSFEYATMRKLRQVGYFCMRSFGSKGANDILAVKNGTALFVQCKHSRYQNTKPENFDLTSLIKLAERFDGKAIFAGVRNRHMYFMVYNGGWKEWKPN